MKPIEKIMDDAWMKLGYKIGCKCKKGKYFTTHYSIKAFSYEDWLKIIKKLEGTK